MTGGCFGTSPVPQPGLRSRQSDRDTRQEDDRDRKADHAREPDLVGGRLRGDTQGERVGPPGSGHPPGVQSGQPLLQRGSLDGPHVHPRHVQVGQGQPRLHPDPHRDHRMGARGQSGAGGSARDRHRSDPGEAEPPGRPRPHGRGVPRGCPQPLQLPPHLGRGRDGRCGHPPVGASPRLVQVLPAAPGGLEHRGGHPHRASAA